MNRLDHTLANRVADVRKDRVVGIVSETFTFPVVLRVFMRPFAIGRHATMLVEHLQMLMQQLLAGITGITMATSWRRNHALCLVQARQEHAMPRLIRIGTSGVATSGVATSGVGRRG